MMNVPARFVLETLESDSGAPAYPVLYTLGGAITVAVPAIPSGLCWCRLLARIFDSPVTYSRMADNK